ncbi:acetyltransferase [Paenibacillus sp. N3/727]|uniref:GNAT family N-acetyltransferase n=1 Tax=Paenibacillus sp. N3/727 TaxID=2925845 RepID=UPI001F5319AD|nr:GNAT family N-acetyltransferase [Paenibacillus sp. N3/727]UNK18625.1 acetyltransferase [Paenibacillus sp. N3/727]
MILYTHNKLTIRYLAETDAPLLAVWLSDPLVLTYYEGRDRPHDLEMVKQHFFDDDESCTRCIVQYDGQDIGYIQYYAITDEERTEYGYVNFTGSIFGMDQFIGETTFWNQGIGTELITTMVRYLLFHEGADKIVMDPQAWNVRALRVYEKVGFVRKKYLQGHEWHEGEYRDCWIIEYEM